MGSTHVRLLDINAGVDCCAEYYKNRSTFDKVIAEIKTLQFVRHIVHLNVQSKPLRGEEITTLA